MRWLRASQFHHVSASVAGWLRQVATLKRMRSVTGGSHGFAGWGSFGRLPETGVGVRADDGRDPLSDAGSSLAAADLCLAELRSVPEISGAAGLPAVLAGEAGRAAVLGARRAFQADQARGTARRRRRVPAALIWRHRTIL